MTIVLSEAHVESLVDMEEAVGAVEEAFLKQASGEAVNSPRTRSRAKGAQLNSMHAASQYLGRGGVKAYMSTARGTKFVFILFDMADGTPLAVMGADVLGRYRTGAASGVATRHLYRRGSAAVGIFGTGRQALTQALALSAVLSVREVSVWSPDEGHRAAFAARLEEAGFPATPAPTPQRAAEGADVVSTITSSGDPFLKADMVAGVSHINLCGGNDLDRSEADPEVIGGCGTVAVDDIPQGKVEYGDLARAVAAGKFSWDRAVPLCELVAGKRKPAGRTLFKSGGAALEDVALGSLLYDKAVRSGGFPDLKLV